jgi:predicted DNA-binding ribbon-helix-helix protein
MLLEKSFSALLECGARAAAEAQRKTSRNKNVDIHGCVMTYSELSKEIEELSYRDKFRLAQLLIQLARKEEEEQNPEKRQAARSSAINPELVQYVAERLRKLRPSKKEALLNSIGAMFQFQGGISDGDKERMFSELQKRRYIVLAENGLVQYPEV